VHGILLAAGCLLLATGAALPQTSYAQATAAADLELSGALKPAERAELRRILQQNAPVLEAQAAVLKAVAKLVGPAVVFIQAEGVGHTGSGSVLEYSHGPQHAEEEGSGVIIQWKERNYVLTNRHVIHGAQPDGIKIKLADGRLVHPQKVWDDVDTDVAVMSIEAANLTAAPIGDSDKLEIGDFVLAVGCPFELDHTVTFGIISAKGRRDLHFGDVTVRFQDFLQTDAAINPGNSGGPLCNVRGEIIGINTAIASNSGRNEGIGFAIPVNMCMFICRQLIETGKVTRAFLGVNLDSRFGAAMAAEIGLPAPMGARVLSITKGSPAEAARLQAGDVILQINGVRVEDDGHLINLVSVIEVGKKAPLLIFRDGKTMTISVEVGDRSRFDRNE
jgi:serine protease Do